MLAGSNRLLRIEGVRTVLVFMEQVAIYRIPIV